MKVITLDINKKIISIKNVLDNYTLQPNEIETEQGEIGQIQQTDGSFINDTTPLPPPRPSELDLLKENIASLSDTVGQFMDYIFTNITTLP